jgi:Tol biopolymer transport system component
VYQPVRGGPRRRLALLVAAGALACGGGAQAPQGSASDGLVFVRLVDGAYELFAARIGDGAERQLTDTPDRNESWPTWAAQAGRLLVQTAPVSERPRAAGDLLLMDPASGAETPLAATPDRVEQWHQVSPDGAYAAFAFRRERGGGVALADLRSGAIREIARTGPGRLYLRPHFAPDGERLVAQRRGDGRGSHLWILAPESAPRALTADPDWIDLKGWFTRDGARIVYTRRPAAGGPHELASIAADGSAPHALPAAGANAHSAQPSPKRDEIAYVASRGPGSEVFLAGISGEGARALTDTPERNEFAPRWSPDGERLVVTVSPVEEGVPRLVDPEGLARTRIVVLDRSGRTLFETAGFMPDWMPPWR